ncbi:MAG: barstar family protein [Planctomycetes bacterium]|nr:barstar family protein [Planctomycetota bacterium]
MVAYVPAGIRTRQQLFEALSRQLALPDYFGNNFDSLEECLRDLSWLPAGTIVLQHRELPFDPGSTDREIYLDVLHDCQSHWRNLGTSPDRLQVELPKADTGPARPAK